MILQFLEVAIFLCSEAGGLPPNRRGFWIGLGEVFGKVFEEVLERFWIEFLMIFWYSYEILWKHIKILENSSKSEEK